MDTVNPIDKMIDFLRDENRIKINVDYSIASKYGEIHIMCCEAYAKNIEEAASLFGIVITSFFTWQVIGRTKNVSTR